MHLHWFAVVSAFIAKLLADLDGAIGRFFLRQSMIELINRCDG